MKSSLEISKSFGIPRECDVVKCMMLFDYLPLSFKSLCPAVVHTSAARVVRPSSKYDLRGMKLLRYHPFFTSLTLATRDSEAVCP